jgi:hypothetical protein
MSAASLSARRTPAHLDCACVAIDLRILISTRLPSSVDTTGAERRRSINLVGPHDCGIAHCLIALRNTDRLVVMDRGRWLKRQRTDGQARPLLAAA